jgi:hypothetical protein
VAKMNNDSELKNFLSLAERLTTKLPKYSSKFSNKIYDNRQKAVILILKQKMRMTYRGISNFLRFSWEARKAINLARVPDHSTLVKFAKRISASDLDSLLEIKEAEIVAIDSSGFETENMSYYFRTVWNMKNKQKARRYLKVSLAIDTKKQIVLSQKIRLGPRNDTIDFMSVLKGLSAKFVVADKGYDSKKNVRFVLDKMKAYPHIPRRSRGGVIYEKLGVKLSFDEKIYHQRSKVETVFSVIKRKYDSLVKSKGFHTQRKEIICRLIAYNLDRKIILSFVFILGFHQSWRG